jgi:hypothetical protein
MRALDQRDGQDPTCPPPDLLHSEVLSYLGVTVPLKPFSIYGLSKIGV